MPTHKPVLLKEVFDILNPSPGDFFIDSTIGMAGHAKEAIDKISPGGLFVGIDRDSESAEKGKENLERYIKEKDIKDIKILVFHTNFVNIPNILEKIGNKKPNCILFDLGFSSVQIFAGKGFSYDQDEPLIMRYDNDVSKLTAARVINEYDRKKLAEIFKKYGEERFADRIASKIVKERKKKSLRTTKDLVKIIRNSLPKNYPPKKRPEARVFLALRNFINNEPENLKEILDSIPNILAKEGKVAVITFNSLEDKIVKESFKKLSKLNQMDILTKKPIKPTQKEIQKNNRARSAKLRVIKLN